jgi:Bacterial regulatory helix-turn-helix protein, lysR family
MTDTRSTSEPQSARNLAEDDDVRHGNIELRHLRYFVAVAEELNLHRAAERLGITQPALTKQIAGLEEQVGLSLLRENGIGWLGLPRRAPSFWPRGGAYSIRWKTR